MSADFERTPRGRPSHKESFSGARTPERKRASSRGRASERERARTPERKRAPSRARASERERTRTPERKRASGRGRASERERARTPERKRAPSRARTTQRERASGRGYRKPAPRRKRAVRRNRFGIGLSHVAVAFLLLLALGKLGNRLLFQELRINHPDQMMSEDTSAAPPLEEAVSQKKLVSDHVNAAAERLNAAAPDHAAQQNRKDGFYTILLAGVDDHNGGSDTVILASVDSKQHQIFGVSIPRDTKAIVNQAAHKINAAYKSGGMPLLAQTVSEQMSIPIDYTVEVDLAGFAALIDAIGGVDFDVPLDMDYEDPKQNLEIHVSQGLQHLDGETALKVVRFRHNSDGSGYGDEDLGRIRTQQNFLKAAVKSVLSLNGLTKLDDIARIFQQYVKTDLTPQNLAWLAKEAFYAGANGIRFATLPGTWHSPFLYTDTEKALSIINEHLNPYQDDLTLDDLNFPQ